MSLVRQMRGGKDYDAQFGRRMRGEGPFADLIAARFANAHRRLGFGRMPALDTTQFIAPRKPSPPGRVVLIAEVVTACCVTPRTAAAAPPATPTASSTRTRRPAGQSTEPRCEGSRRNGKERKR